MVTPFRLLVATATTSMALVSVLPAAHAQGGSAPPPGKIVIVQAVPGDSLDVTVDGRTVQQATSLGSVVGPIAVAPGKHEVGFVDSSGDVRLRSTVVVASGSSSDIVVHLPAALHGTPVVNSYRTPRSAIAPGKARVLIAHTATVAPADVRVDGQVVFRDIANGEYATADVAAGSHSVALLPAGLTKHPILGPLSVDLKAGTVTMVYAVGSPRNRSMNVISHTATLTANGAVVPAGIDTGSAGLAADVAVHPFGARTAGARSARSAGTQADRPASPFTVDGAALLAAGLVAGLGAGLVLGRGSRRRRHRPEPR